MAVVGLAAVPSGHAQRFWDTNGADAGAGSAPTGTWAADGTTWSASSAGTDAAAAYTTTGGDALYFVAGPGVGSGNSEYIVTVDGTQAAGSLNFQASGNATISGGTVINLAGGIGIPQYAYGTTDNGNVTINTPITMTGAQSWLNNHRSQLYTPRLLTVGGAVDNGGYLLTLGGSTTYDGGITINSLLSGSGGVTKTGAGTARLDAANTYGGVTTINGGVLQVKRLANGGLASSLGQSSSDPVNLVIDGGTLRYQGGTAGANINRGFTLGTAGGTISADGRSLTITGNIALAGTDTARTLTLNAAYSGDNVLSSKISDNGAGKTAVTLDRSPDSTWRLSNVGNDYTGVTTVIANRWGGALRVVKLANGGLASSIGASTSDAANLVLTSSEALQDRRPILDYRGTGDSTDRLLTISRSSSGTGVHGGEIANHGSGALHFTSTGAIAWGTADQSRRLVLGGGYGGLAVSTFAPLIQDNGTGAVSFEKGAYALAVWEITNPNNTYSGKTYIYNPLRVSSLNSTGAGRVATGSNLGAPTTVVNGTIDIGTGSDQTGTLIYVGPGETTDRVINLSGAGGGAVLNQSGAGLLKFTSNFTATGAGSKTVTLTGSTAGAGEIAGAVVNHDATRQTSLRKQGTGTWTLSGASTYTGQTSVDVGTLRVDGRVANGKVVIANGARLEGSGTIVLRVGDVASEKIVSNGTFVGTDLTLEVQVADGTTAESFVLVDCSGGTLIGADTLTVQASGWAKAVEPSRVLLKKITGTTLLIR